MRIDTTLNPDWVGTTYFSIIFQYRCFHLIALTRDDRIDNPRIYCTFHRLYTKEQTKPVAKSIQGIGKLADRKHMHKNVPRSEP
jgi:hypothetical protein